MKRTLFSAQPSIFVTCLLSLLSLTTIAQHYVPTNKTLPGAPNVVAAPPSAYPDPQQNTIWSWDVTQPTSNLNDVTSSNAAPEAVKLTVQYFDGLGKPIEAVVRKESPAGYDLVSPSTYDAYGREVIKYLPYIDNNTSGDFVANPFNAQKNFYTTIYNNAGGHPDPNGEQCFYSQTDYEPSPLNRILETYAPGNSWVGNGVGTTASYLVNTGSENIHVWTIDLTVSGTLPSTSNSAVYGDGQLNKIVSSDE